jgi:hypothetical protein
MTSHRTTLLTLASLVVITAFMPSLASASPLLGGYGGPGEGDQTILGSALLNGPRNGGGSGGGSGSAGSSSTSLTSRGLPVGGARTRAHAAGGPGHGKQTTGATGQALGKPSDPDSISERGGAAPSAVADSGMLGLSGADLLYVLLVLGALALTAVLTRRLTRIAVTGSTGS